MKKKDIAIIVLVVFFFVLAFIFGDSLVAVKLNRIPIINFDSEVGQHEKIRKNGIITNYVKCEDGVENTSLKKDSDFKCNSPYTVLSGKVLDKNDDYITVSIKGISKNVNTKSAITAVIGSEIEFEILKSDRGNDTYNVDKYTVVEPLFKDEVFKNAVLTKLNLSSEQKLTKERIEKVNILELPSEGITDIKGIEIFTNLEVLQLSDNSISDISYLKDLKKLRNLFIHSNIISDMSAVSTLDDLVVLNIENNDIRDISSIKDLKKMSGFSYNGNPIVSFSVLHDKIEEMAYNSTIYDDFNEGLAERLRSDDINRDKELSIRNDKVIEQLKEWVKENITGDMSDLEKEYKIIDHISERFTYDYTLTTSYRDLEDMYNKNKSVCFGYSLIFQYLADFAGLKNYKVFAKSNIEGQAGHVWNAVEIDGVYYQVDVTWYDVSNEPDYRYINVSNEEMIVLHNNNYIPTKIDNMPKASVSMDKKIKCKNRDSICLNN